MKNEATTAPQEYDVVIVGSGIGGCAMTKILNRAGKKGLLLEAGLKAGSSLDAQGSYYNSRQAGVRALLPF